MIIDGKAFAANLRESLAKDVQDHALTPGLAVILVGDILRAMSMYVTKLQRARKQALKALNLKCLRIAARMILPRLLTI